MEARTFDIMEMLFFHCVVSDEKGVFEDQRLEFAPWVTDEQRYLVLREPLEPPPDLLRPGQE